MSNFSKPLPELYQSDPRLLGSGCKKYSVQRSSSSESHVLPTPADNSKESLPPPSTFQELDAEISAFKCSSHYKTCSQGRGGCFGRNFFSESEVRATEMLQLLSVYREKTRKLNKDDLEQYVLNNIFKKHCINIDEVINQTQEERTNLFGKPIVGDNGCGEEDISDSGDSAGEDCWQNFTKKDDEATNCSNCSNFQCSNLSYCSNINGEQQSKRKFSFCHPSSSNGGKQQPSKKASASKVKRSPLEKKFEYDWTLSIDSGLLPDRTQTRLKLCVSSICFLYGISQNKIRRCAKKMKTHNTSDIKSARGERNYDHRSYFGGNDCSMEDVCKIFDDNGLDVGVMEQRAALVRSSNVHIDAMLWMESYFFQFESQPNSKQIHVDYTFKRTIYEEYRVSINPSAPAGKLSEGQFKELWSSLYDFVKIRKSKRISGKCWTCAYINELRQKQKGEEVMRACKHLMIMHRGGLFMLERLEYRRRIQEAVSMSPNTIMSSIIDGASQNHCTIPHPGENVEFSNGLEQHIEGVLTHGHGFTIYRSFPTVDADADFTIFCLLSELEKWKDSHLQNFPQTWYIQIDGGSENANKYLFAALEYIVAKRLVQKIVLTRLPVGHTHEDIDACFGVIATWYGRHIVHTPQEYAEAIESAFGAESSKLKCKVVDVFVVPNYQEFFSSSIDPHFGRTHKLEWTQHQYRFEAVTVSDYFPNGVKFTYRKYSCDKVVLIDKKPIINCRTPVGILTGLEPKTVLSQWYPTANLYANRPHEGMYLLRNLPGVDFHTIKLPPKPLIVGCKKVFDDLKLKINKHYRITDTKRTMWNEWFSRHAPRDEDAGSYTRTHRYVCPLMYYFKSGVQNIPSSWAALLPTNSFSIFPANIVVALPSVQCQFDRHGAAAPFMQVEIHEAGQADSVIARYEQLRISEFARMKRLQGKRLKEIVTRKVKENGAKYPHSGTIEKLSGIIFTCDSQFTFMRLEPTHDAEQRQLINDLFEGGAMRNLNANSIVVTINNRYPIDVKCIQSFNTSQYLSVTAMDAFLELCILRDLQLVTAFNEVNSDKAGYVPRTGCTYLNSQFARLLMQSDLSVEQFISDNLVADLIQNQSFQRSYRIIIPLLWRTGDSEEWLLIIVESSAQTVHFLFAKFSGVIESQISDDAKAALSVSIQEKLEAVLTSQQQQLVVANTNENNQPTITWTFVNHFNSTSEDVLTESQKRIPLAHNRGVPAKSDSGIYIMHSIECDYFDVPIFAHLDVDWQNIRHNLAYCVINEQLMIS